MTAFVEVQQLMGAKVTDTAGQLAGRIESIRAEIAGPRCTILEYHLGASAMLSRLGIATDRLFGRRLPDPLRVPWHQIDLTDPKHPRLRCTLGALRAQQRELPPFEDGAPPKREPNG